MKFHNKPILNIPDKIYVENNKIYNNDKLAIEKLLAHSSSDADILASWKESLNHFPSDSPTSQKPRF
ncbi:MAG: hypothetical protein JWM09_1032 [Francisellaceae bacterium]|nr:hypothetical protein [Francisellaceae bacterium]